MARNSRTSLASLTFFCFWTWIAVSRHQIAAHRVSSDSELSPASFNMFRDHGRKYQLKRATQQHNKQQETVKVRMLSKDLSVGRDVNMSSQKKPSDNSTASYKRRRERNVRASNTTCLLPSSPCRGYEARQGSIEWQHNRSSAAVRVATNQPLLPRVGPLVG